MNRDNQQVVFRRVRGRLVPIRIKTPAPKSAKPHKTNYGRTATFLSGAAAIAEGIYLGSKELGKTAKKGKLLKQSAALVPKSKKFNANQLSFSFVKEPLNVGQVVAKKSGNKLFKIGIAGRFVLGALGAYSVSQVAGYAFKKKEHKAHAQKIGFTLGGLASLYGFGKGYFTRLGAAARFTRMTAKRVFKTYQNAQRIGF